MTSLGEYLRVAKISTREFARRADVPGPMVSLWSRGIGKPGLRNALKIQVATKGLVTVDYWESEAYRRLTKRRPDYSESKKQKKGARR